MPLEREMATFHRELPKLLEEQRATLNPDHYALVRADAVHSTWQTEGDAVQAGYLLFGNEPFLVKEIAEKEKVYRISGRAV